MTLPLPSSTFGTSPVCAYTSLTRDGRPVTWPVTPYTGPRGTIDVSTGLTYPGKAERARRDPRVALLFEGDPVVLVQGRATVRDADLQANTDRYVRDSRAKVPDAFAGLPWFLLKRLTWYFARIYVEVTPERVTWWHGGDLTRAPLTWTCPPGTEAPASDPPPSGPPLPGRCAPPADWRPHARRARDLGRPIVSTVTGGLPVTVPARAFSATATGYELDLPAGVAAVPGPVCLTFHRHDPGMRWQENVVLLGTATVRGDDRLGVAIDRALPDWSLPEDRRLRTRSFLGHGRLLRRRVRAEAARRAQPVPKVRLGDR
ncbi:hemerythrin [Nonomuraea rhodomycinica]|uniref:Hemerythrin n=1 Tax=Nonomuraea rhodomycinica TaxID=1712872 RepID=A0A7Y6IRK7_9ACTN|nr:hemerythrin [Nonomuraea rhodomycinica]NUW43092.1 hemerythrin [Nonomuraea rhodomycinica]